MAIKSDGWIRRMAEEHQMIEPFADRQVRDGVISYGVSSYGYDMRVADEFRIFHNALFPVVDPKNFDERSFLEYQGDVCIVPPNSFALARSIEYFRIPRSVLTICVGKSTYARCFSADTRVRLVDTSTPTLEEMARRAEDGEQFWGYSIGRHGRIIVARLEAPRLIGRDALIEIELDNGRRIRCTSDHGFITRDGRVSIADELRPGHALMPLYTKLGRGYESVYQPLDGHLYPTHRLADEWNLRHGIYEEEPGTHRHHCDGERLNNNPWNIERMDAADHVRLHNAQTFGPDFDGEAHSGAIRDALGELGKDPEWHARYSEAQSARARAFWHDKELRETANPVLNHKVRRVRHLPGDHDVYCLSVSEAGNFALDAGVFVENCGLIVNVTPFEPEWEGHVTLEISNTTPLPARVYANEGIAQVLFFESDEVCEVSYADKAGKYQGQTGVTPPKL